jgi:UDP-glucose 4-epimerase
MKKCIVTGGCGFIGSHLAEKLIALGYQVIILDNLSNGTLLNIKYIKKKIKFIKCDISKKGSWQKHFKNANLVFHFAALADIVPSIQKPEEYFNANVVGTLNVLESSRQYKVKKIIYAASSSCYGIPESYPTNEKEQVNPIYPYAITKKIGEDLLLDWSKIYGLNVTSLRFFNVYGLRSRTSGTYGAMFGVFLAQKLNNRQLTIVGNGKQKRDFLNVKDAVKAIISASKIKESNLIINIGSGKTFSVEYIANLICKKSRTYLPKRPGEPDITWANIALAKKKLKWVPKVNIEIGVKELLENINYWKKAPIWDKKNIKKVTKDWFKYLS